MKTAARQKDGSPVSQRKYRSEAERADAFCWHLLDGMRESFSHDHWWLTKKDDITPEAGHWEALRRHPEIQRAMGKPHQSFMFQESTWRHDGLRIVPLRALTQHVAKHALKDWQQLSAEHRKKFRELLWATAQKYRAGGAPPPPAVALDSVADVGNWIDEGHLVVALDPGAAPGAAAKWVERQLKRLRDQLEKDGRLKKPKSPRFGDKRLNVIAEHEADYDEAMRTGGNLDRVVKVKRNGNDDYKPLQLPARYRRVIQNSWPEPTASKGQP